MSNIALCVLDTEPCFKPVYCRFRNAISQPGGGAVPAMYVLYQCTVYTYNIEARPPILSAQSFAGGGGGGGTKRGKKERNVTPYYSVLK